MTPRFALRKTAVQAAAFGLAAVVTFAMLGSVDRLAVEQHAGVALARSPAAEPVQQVVVIGQRLPRV